MKLYLTQNSGEYLFKCSHAQHLHFLLSQVAPIATTHVLLCQSGKVDAIEFSYMVTQTFKDTAHNAILAAVDFDAHLFLIRGMRIFHRICLDDAVIQRDAFRNALNVGCGHVLIGRNMIYFLLQELGMSQFGSQFAVVRQQ